MRERDMTWRDEPKAYPAEAIGLDPAATQTGADDGIGGSMTSFADLVAPRRWVNDAYEMRNRYLGDPARARAVAADEVSSFTIATWAMIVVAGLTLGVVLTLIAASNS